MPTYDITDHALLSSKAQHYANNDPEHLAIFQANVLGAELIHNLKGTTYTGEEADLAKLILVYQVNLQFEQDGNMEVYKRLEEGDRLFEYKDIAISDLATRLRKQLSDIGDEDLKPNKKIRPATKGVNNVSSW